MGGSEKAADGRPLDKGRVLRRGTELTDRDICRCYPFLSLSFSLSLSSTDLAKLVMRLCAWLHAEGLNPLATLMYNCDLFYFNLWGLLQN